MTAESKRGGNLLSLGLAQLFRMGSGLAVNVLLMRFLGVDGYGVYGYVITLVGLAGFAANLTMNRLIKREVARAPSRAGGLVATGMVATAGLSVVASGGIVAWAAVVDGRGVVILASALAALALTLQSLAMVPEAAFHGMRRMGLSVRGHVTGRVVLVAVTAGLLWGGAGITAVFVAQVLDALVTLCVIGWMYKRHLDLAALQTSWSAVRDLVKAAAPFGLNTLFGSIYLSVDVLLLAVMKGDNEVGVYRGAVMLIALFPVVANTLTAGLFPRMAKHLGQPEAAGAELRFATRVLLAVSVPAAVGGILTARPLMVLFGGEAFAVSALPFIVMAPLLPLRFLNNGYAMTLSSLDRQGDRTRGVFLAAILNLVANLVAIPVWGALGAAGTTLVTEVALAVWMRWRIQPLVTGLRLWESVLRVSLPAGVMAGCVLALPELHVLVVIAVGALVYAVAGRVTGAWRPQDLRRLRRV